MTLARLLIFIYVKPCIKLLIYVHVCLGCCFHGMNGTFFKKVVPVSIIGLFNIFLLILSHDCKNGDASMFVNFLKIVNL